MINDDTVYDVHNYTVYHYWDMNNKHLWLHSSTPQAQIKDDLS